MALWRLKCFVVIDSSPITSTRSLDTDEIVIIHVMSESQSACPCAIVCVQPCRCLLYGVKAAYKGNGLVPVPLGMEWPRKDEYSQMVVSESECKLSLSFRTPAGSTLYN